MSREVKMLLAGSVHGKDCARVKEEEDAKFRESSSSQHPCSSFTRALHLRTTVETDAAVKLAIRESCGITVTATTFDRVSSRRQDDGEWIRGCSFDVPDASQVGILVPSGVLIVDSFSSTGPGRGVRRRIVGITSSVRSGIRLLRRGWNTLVAAANGRVVARHYKKGSHADHT